MTVCKQSAWACLSGIETAAAAAAATAATAAATAATAAATAATAIISGVLSPDLVCSHRMSMLHGNGAWLQN